MKSKKPKQLPLKQPRNLQMPKNLELTSLERSKNSRNIFVRLRLLSPELRSKKKKPMPEFKLLNREWRD